MGSIKKNFLYNASYQLLNICIPLVTTPYISRILGAENIGIYSYSFSIAHLFSIFIMLGLNNYGCREIAKVRGDKNSLSKTFCSIYSMQIVLGALVNGVYFTYCLIFAENQVAALLLGLYTLSSCFDVSWFFFGLEKFKLTTIINFSVKLIKTFAIFIFINDIDDIYVYCFLMSSGFLISQIVLWSNLLKTIKVIIPSIKEVLVHVKPNCLLFVTVIAVTVYKQMDKIMLGNMSTIIQVGFYESSEKILSIPIAMITALGTIMLPRMTNILSEKKEKNNDILHISILFAMFLSSTMCFGIMGVSKEFVPIFYGDGYEICIYLYLILLPSCIFLAFANVIRSQYLLPHQMDREYIVSAILGAVVNLSINAVLIKPLGAVGVSIGTFVAEAVVCIYQSLKVAKKINLSRYLYESIPFVLSGFIMFTVLYFNDISSINYLFSIVVKIVLGMVIYFTTLYLICKIMKINYLKTVKNIKNI